MKNKKVGRVLITILQIISFIGLIVVIYFLYKAYSEEQRIAEDNSEMRVFTEHNVTEEGIKVIVNKKDFEIKHEGNRTLINDQKIDFYAMKVYVTDSLLILSSAGQYGEALQFYDSDLNNLYDSKEMQFSDIELKDGKITASGINTRYMALDGYVVDTLNIVACSETVTKRISNFKNTIQKHENEIVDATYTFAYDTELIIEINDRKTIGDIFNAEIADDTDKYCVIIE